MIYAIFDETGHPTAFYDDRVHGPRQIDGQPNLATKIPAAAVEITEEDHGRFLAAPGKEATLDPAEAPITLADVIDGLEELSRGQVAPKVAALVARKRAIQARR